MEQIKPPVMGQDEFDPTRQQALLEAWRKAYHARTNIGVLLGIMCSVFAKVGTGVLSQAVSVGTTTNLILMVALGVMGRVLWVWGCQGYAMSKGKKPSAGYWGLLGFLGLLVLALMKKDIPYQPWPGFLKLPLLRIPVAQEPPLA